MGSNDEVYDPIIYDAMRELATLISGKYVARAYAATTPAEDRHWIAQRDNLLQQVLGIDPHDSATISAKRDELRALYRVLRAEDALRSRPQQ